MTRRPPPIVVAGLFLAACSKAPDENRASNPAALELVALPTTDHVGGLAREPMIVEGADGSLFVAGYGTEKPTLWRSADGGASWEAVDVGSEADGAVGNSDVDLAVAPDGKLYFVVMSYDRQVFEGRGVAAATSLDGGATWSWSSLSRDRFDDRPWIEVAPDGVVHAVWNDGAGVSHAVSTDRGRTWTELARVHASGGSSHLAIGPGGTLAVRVTPLSASGNKMDPGTDGIAVSRDGGATWEMRDLPGTRTWTGSFDPKDGVLRWVEPIAWDSTGALYTLSSEGTVLWLGRSTDDGTSWTRWPVVEDSAMVYFPYLVARGSGELAATWFSGSGDALRANLALIDVDDGSEGAPHVTRAEPFAFPAFRPVDADSTLIRDTAGEYIPIVFLRDGRLAVVTTIQDPVNDRGGFTFRPYRIGAR
jgi:hypothetical protein